MAEPWDIPPFPEHGDKSADITWAAVGRALTQWEELELYLARLYAKIAGLSPIEAISLPAYRDAPNFRDRANIIEKAAVRRFVIRPDQAQEAMFESVMAIARKLAKRRNDIAHGVLQLYWQSNATFSEAIEIHEFMLTPATYRAKMFNTDRTKPAYLFSSVEINHFTEQFRRHRDGPVELLIALWE